MEYIRIMNEVEDYVPRMYLEKLGISTKRNDDATIGQFGSGIKLAPIAALRRGWDWIFAGCDETSPYILSYGIKNDGDFDHVVYEYIDLADGGFEPSTKETSFTVDAGVLSWDTDFQIFREALANAVDEFIRNGSKFSVEVVDIERDEDFYVKGHFCVYLTAHPDLVYYVDNFDEYFLFNRTPIYSRSNVAVYDPVKENRSLYHKGILVNFDESSYNLAVFDYDLTNIKLNEERRLRDYWDVRYQIANFINSCDDVEILKKLFVAMNNDAYLEHDISEYSAGENEFLAEAFFAVYGEKAVIVPPNCPASHMRDVKYRGYVPVEVGSGFWFSALNKSGVQTGSDVTGVPMDIEEVEPNLYQTKMIEKAVRIVAQFDSRILDLPDCKVFKPTVSQRILGLYHEATKQIFVSVDTLDSIETTVATIVHELDHHVTGNGNHDEAFRDAADQRIAKLMINFYELIGD